MKRLGTRRAKGLRRRSTEAERKFWYAVRDRRFEGFKFKRQVPIDPWIVDFLCAEARLVVEIDGGHHADSKRDPIRTAYLEARGYRVIRFWNADVLANLDGVMYAVLEKLTHNEAERTPPHPVPLPGGERGR
jgi:very-short-patch-repair endonuclease